MGISGRLAGPRVIAVTATYRFGSFELQPEQRRLLVEGRPVALGPRAFDVLVALVERAGQLVPKAQLLDLGWPGVVVEENNLQVQVSALRKVLGPDAIATIPGRGYRFSWKPTSVDAVERHNETTPSIAVLPFANVSSDSTNEYFADGLSEELLNVLAKIRGLRVTSRTSAFFFKGKDADLPTIAQRLNVTTLLQGSVRKMGNRVRIAVQLIHADTDTHLWSETYDRELDDIFAVQDDIAHAVVTELRKTLMGEHPNTLRSEQVRTEITMAVKGRAENAEVHRLYLEGRFFLERQSSQDVGKGIELLQRAVGLDPTYALAWAALSRAYIAGSWTNVTTSRNPRAFDLARASAEHARTLQPELPDAHAVLGWVCMLADWDWSGADESIGRALELAPNHVEAIRYASLLAANLGRTDEALELHQRAVALDPLSWHALHNLANYYLGAGLPDAAAVAVEKAIDLNPLAELTYFVLGKTRLEQKRPDDALVAFQRMGGAMRLLGIALAQSARGLQRESGEAVRDLIEGYADTRAFQVAEACAFRREFDLSFAWLERAHKQRAAELCQAKWDPLLRNLHGDSRWNGFLNKLGLTE